MSDGLISQSRADQEGRREQWQKVPQILAAMNVRPGATVADIGAGDGFFTTRLARAVQSSGRVYAVDIDDSAIDRLRKRLQQDGIQNVIVVKGAPDSPNLPEGVIDAALIVNAYHEMDQHQSMLSALRRALKPEGRLVIVEPVGASRRGRSRAEQTRNHEIDPEHVLQDARSAGFRVVGLQDPFTVRGGDLEWLMALQPGDLPAPTTAAAVDLGETASAALKDPSLRISHEELTTLASGGHVTIVDVRDHDSFAAGRIPGALSIPLETVENAVERLRRLSRPVVTYCS
ncbi:MAG TPA: methyltransferase domain-containing protein [Vicinamibacterales bacterium]|nr:methyltransferase domain-containing protein [Vicinamibacterales bacterium]